MRPDNKKALEDLAAAVGQGLDDGRVLRNIEVLMEDRDGQGILQHALMGAEAYALGNQVAFRTAPDLQIAAHEAAHVIQQNQSAIEFLQQRAQRP